MITVQWCLHSVAVGEIIFSKEGINEHLLMDPKLTPHTKKVSEGTQIFNPECLFYLTFDEC